MKYIQKIKSFSKKILLLILGIIVGATFSVYAAGVWHGTDWIQTGEVISAQKIKDNFDYLYENGGGGGGSATFVSSEQTIKQDNEYITVAHGLGTEPVTVQLSLINKVAEKGYDVGDTIVLSPPVGTNTYQHWGPNILVDNINIKVFDQSFSYLPNKKPASRKEKPTQIDLNKWKLIIKATGKSGGSFAQKFTSSELTLSGSKNLITVAHGLGRVPMIVQISIINKVADRGYEPGDIVILNPPVGTNTYQHWGASVSVDDVNINVMDRKTLYLPTKTDGKPAGINWNSWKLIINAI